jgi:hypothetical protein
MNIIMTSFETPFTTVGLYFAQRKLKKLAKKNGHHHEVFIKALLEDRILLWKAFRPKFIVISKHPQGCLYKKEILPFLRGRDVDVIVSSKIIECANKQSRHKRNRTENFLKNYLTFLLTSQEARHEHYSCMNFLDVAIEQNYSNMLYWLYTQNFFTNHSETIKKTLVRPSVCKTPTYDFANMALQGFSAHRKIDIVRRVTDPSFSISQGDVHT